MERVYLGLSEYGIKFINAHSRLKHDIELQIKANIKNKPKINYNDSKDTKDSKDSKEDNKVSVNKTNDKDDDLFMTDDMELYEIKNEIEAYNSRNRGENTLTSTKSLKIPGFNKVTRLQEADSKEITVTQPKKGNLNNVTLTKSSFNANKKSTTTDFIDLDSLYFTDKVNTRSKSSLQVPNLGLKNYSYLTKFDTVKGK